MAHNIIKRCVFSLAANQMHSLEVRKNPFIFSARTHTQCIRWHTRGKEHFYYCVMARGSLCHRADFNHCNSNGIYGQAILMRFYFIGEYILSACKRQMCRMRMNGIERNRKVLDLISFSHCCITSCPFAYADVVMVVVFVAISCYHVSHDKFSASSLNPDAANLTSIEKKKKKKSIFHLVVLSSASHATY